MSGAIQAAIYNGFQQLANVPGIGQAVQQYRPTGAVNPTSMANLLGTINAYFNTKADFTGLDSPIIGKAAWYVALNGGVTAVGDYLVGAATGVPGDTNTWFISDQSPLLSIGVVKCNGVISVLRPTGNTGYGAQPYGGDAGASETPIMTNWPASIIQGTKGEKGDSTLPGDVRMPWFNFQFPAYSNVQVETADVIDDDLGRRFKVSSCELTTKGWRLTALLAET